ncbi:MAG TPA: glycosyltransferase [Anaerolineales bacterium]|nr:glycosyltransferase [Anaerolineales bacterium]
MIKQAVCYSFSLNADEPMAYLRLTAPLREAGITLLNGFENRQTRVDAVHEADVVIFQREFPTRVDDYLRISALARQEGKPVIFEVDDLLFSLPEIHPDRNGQYYAPTLLPMFQALVEADLVTVTTPKLRETLLEFNPNIVVLPNFLDEQIWQMRPPAPKDPADPLTIGFMGTNSHQPDLAYITPVLLELRERYPDRLKFHFWGAPPPHGLNGLPDVAWTSQYFSSYREFAAFFQTQTADIFVAPLVDHLFNRCKSPIKFLEYSALGVPGVYSRLNPFTDLITHGQEGWLAASPDEWREGLEQLIENDTLRVQLVTQAQATIREKWLLAQNAFRWQEAYQFAVERAAKKEPHVLPGLMQSMNVQLFEAFQRRDAIEQSLRAKIAELTGQLAAQDQAMQVLNAQLTQSREEVESLKIEILSYVLSKSWRMTRPFRKAGKLLKRQGGADHA